MDEVRKLSNGATLYRFSTRIAVGDVIIRGFWEKRNGLSVFEGETETSEWVQFRPEHIVHDGRLPALVEAALVYRDRKVPTPAYPKAKQLTGFGVMPRDAPADGPQELWPCCIELPTPDISTVPPLTLVPSTGETDHG